MAKAYGKAKNLAEAVERYPNIVEYGEIEVNGECTGTLTYIFPYSRSNKSEPCDCAEYYARHIASIFKICIGKEVVLTYRFEVGAGIGEKKTDEK
jgi:hypothetical protein